jgi:hypothetical protein
MVRWEPSQECAGGLIPSGRGPKGERHARLAVLWAHTHPPASNAHLALPGM